MNPIEKLQAQAKEQKIEKQNDFITKLFQKTQKYEIGEYQKSAKTLGRLPSEWELGKEFKTYVKDSNGEIILESTNTITKDIVIARNPEALYSEIVVNDMFEHRQTIFNEWLVPKDTWVKNYGRIPESKEAFNHFENFSQEFVDEGMVQPSSIFEPMQKIAKIQAIEITEEIYKKLQKILDTDKEGLLLLEVEWSKEPMRFGVNDYITNQGYAINAGEMEKTYQKTRDLGIEPKVLEKIKEEIKPTAPGN